MKTSEQTFPFAAGNLALDLLNTRGRWGGEAIDELRSPSGLRDWLHAHGLARAPDAVERLRSPPTVRTLLTEARRLREALAGLVEAHRTGAAVEAHVLYAVNRVLDASRLSASLHLATEAAWLAELEAGETPLAILAPIARAAAELVIQAAPDRIRRCTADDCTLWFLDTSKGGRRKWCSMERCGNRAKATRHRRRAATG